ncbi:MAG: sugar phosphate nucleotidyltransferase [Solirubrobacteraceae bacterium]
MSPHGVDTAVVLCGGRGTRLQEHTQAIPKPLVEVGGLPIVWHVVCLYAAQGVDRVLLLTGYKSAMVEAFAAAADWPAGVRVECVDTGPDTPTGGRIHAVADRVAGRPYFATYGDGVADIELAALAAAHTASGAVATMTVVRPELSFGIAVLDADGRVTGFREKPRAEQWVNGGFFLFAPGFARYLGPDLVLEREPLETLAADGGLHAYRHDGFWACMDTYKDAVRLNDLWAEGAAPWRRGAS